MFEPILVVAGIIQATGLVFTTGTSLALFGALLILFVVVLIMAGGLSILSVLLGGLISAIVIGFLIVAGLALLSGVSVGIVGFLIASALVTGCVIASSITLGFVVASSAFFGFLVVPFVILGLIVVSIVALVVLGFSWRYFKGRLNVKGKAVFISGCDSGFGNALALKLDRLGMKVYAGCLTHKGVVELEAASSPALVPIQCDITLEEDVAKAAMIVEDCSPEGLYALVNNAGVLYLGEWDWLPKDYLRQTMEVNFFGHVNVTHAFLPQLKKTKGRIINVSSVVGLLAPKYLGSYACAKYALEAFSDSLRRELDKWGISVYVVEPSSMNTPMVQSRTAVLEIVWNDLDEEVKQEYGHNYYRALESSTRTSPGSPDVVVNALYDKITLRHPSLRSRVGKLQHTLPVVLLQALPTFMSDMVLKLGKSPLPAALAKNDQ
eukprot:Phypoly_transcript_07944.p1 GENE.Phypoly_transcript_07944~~Phypoly_transcript_07944.p1  ORF type:complete len:436 (+),score=55.35 Phypoly_transcript_07944:212-1519(+)